MASSPYRRFIVPQGRCCRPRAKALLKEAIPIVALGLGGYIADQVSAALHGQTKALEGNPALRTAGNRQEFFGEGSGNRGWCFYVFIRVLIGLGVQGHATHRPPPLALFCLLQYQGESERLVRNLFEIVRFFDRGFVSGATCAGAGQGVLHHLHRRGRPLPAAL